MFFIIGIVVVFGSVAGGYAPHGDFRVLWQPFEFIIILGAALGGFVISNPKDVTFATGRHLGRRWIHISSAIRRFSRKASAGVR